MALIHIAEDTSPVGKGNPLPTIKRGYSYSHISTQSTTTPKTTAGFLHTVTINDDCAGAITIYDNNGASGTVIAVIKAATAEQTLTFDVEFGTALTVVTAAACDLTVSYI